MTAGKSVEEMRGHVSPVGLSTAPNPNYVTQISTIDMLPVSLSWTHVIADVRSCFWRLQQICNMRQHLSNHALPTFRALIVSKVDSVA